MRIAVLDNDRSQAELICQVLTSAGHICHSFQTAKDVLAQLRKDSYDMLILDWQVVDLGGAEVLRRAREKLPDNAPVLFLTTSSGEDDIVAGLTAGADDYMIKPLRRSEMVARVQALLRRAYPAQNGAESLQFGQYVFETRPGRLLMDGIVLDVTHKEFYLALLFFRNIGRPLSRAYIHEAVWIRETVVPSRTMDTHVSRVRNKLQLKPENGFRLVPVYSYGYRLEKLGA
ncbi:MULTISPECIES: response regulator transcription factor [unclassified Duganella]|jgi:DNA-binding response OmpR family regulator|uniref:response regulator transcription factor n=1 Tax=unclassified Duganella TaxID=2636909 RepID=UPI00087F225B|nr:MULTISPECIES: response regulator transcription factor [unclassified Duganella]SDG92680.1 DNA-binding response regulator, OmpR family, contains REC and winged-helix (wHTH) domain [Duganella sp. OV458]SDJ49687.1 DNA-binding response regulator, OmpR family, contains REC and winged-helix (wHTH) domain [Duganella sp. OV510]